MIAYKALSLYSIEFYFLKNKSNMDHSLSILRSEILKIQI